MIDVFDEEEGQLLRRLFAYTVEEPLSLRTVDLSILGSSSSPGDRIAAPDTADGDTLALLSQISIVPEDDRSPLDLVDRISAVMLVAYRRGFHRGADRAGLPTSEDPMGIVDFYPGLQEACAQYSLIEASTAALQAQSRLRPLKDRRELVHVTLDLYRRSMRASYVQGYRTAALAADALRRGAACKLADSLGSGEVPRDDPNQNRIIGEWLTRLGWDDLQREILRHQTQGFWTRLERVGRDPRLVGLPTAEGNWTEAEEDYMAGVLIAIAQAGIRVGLRLQLQLAMVRRSLPSERERRLTYRISRSIALMARQWRSWHPAPSAALRVRQVGEYLMAPTFGSGAALGHMMGEALREGGAVESDRSSVC